MSTKGNIEELFRSRLEGAEITPSPRLWKAIQQQLRWPQFLRFYPGRFNIYYAGVLLIAAAATVWVLSGQKNQPAPPVPGESILLRPTGENAAGELPEEKSPEKTPYTATGSEKQSNPSALSGKDKEPLNENAGTLTGTRVQESGDSLLKNAEPTEVLSPVMANEPMEEPSPMTYFTSSIQSGCAPLTVQFTNQSVHATSFSWDFGTGDQSREQNPVYEFKEPGRYVVSLRAENKGSLPTVSRMMVEVLAAPRADFQIDEGLEGADNHVVLNLVNYSSEGTVFAWNLVNEDCVNCSGWSSVGYQPALELKSITPDSRSVRLEVISENGCSDTAVRPLPLVVQSSETRIKFANAFSPNPSGPGDGSFHPGSKRIDLFHPLYIEVPVEMRMRIYTRRGELIFETRELYQGWDGYLQHEPAPGDVYVWMAEGRWADGESFSYRGDVTVVWNQYW